MALDDPLSAAVSTDKLLPRRSFDKRFRARVDRRQRKIGEIDDQLAQKRRQIWQLVNSSQATPLKAALKQRKSFENAASQRQPERRRAYSSLRLWPRLPPP